MSSRIMNYDFNDIMNYYDNERFERMRQRIVTLESDIELIKEIMINLVERLSAEVNNNYDNDANKTNNGVQEIDSTKVENASGHE